MVLLGDVKFQAKMTTFSGLGLSLSIVFGCLLLALVAELYYLLWWKKRITDREIEDEYRNFAKELLHLVCWKRPSSLHSTINDRKEIGDPDANDGHEPVDLELGSSKDVLLKANNGEEGVESELMRLHNLAGPPRFLFTIKEETKEDLESEDGKSRGSRKGSRTRSLSDLILSVDTPFLTPLASPRLKSSPLDPLDSYKHHGFNPLFESSTGATELNRFRSSPPPKFKFLRDAEEKLYRRLMEEAEKRASQNSASAPDSGAKTSLHSATQTSPTSATLAEEKVDGSFFTFLVGKNKDREILHQNYHQKPQYPSSSSQVLPLASSPTTFRPLDKETHCAIDPHKSLRSC